MSIFENEIYFNKMSKSNIQKITTIRFKMYYNFSYRLSCLPDLELRPSGGLESLPPGAHNARCGASAAAHLLANPGHLTGVSGRGILVIISVRVISALGHLDLHAALEAVVARVTRLTISHSFLSHSSSSPQLSASGALLLCSITATAPGPVEAGAESSHEHSGDEAGSQRNDPHAVALRALTLGLDLLLDQGLGLGDDGGLGARLDDDLIDGQGALRCVGVLGHVDTLTSEPDLGLTYTKKLPRPDSRCQREQREVIRYQRKAHSDSVICSFNGSLVDINVIFIKTSTHYCDVGVY